jgi:AcrR family transcriptional regulator
MTERPTPRGTPTTAELRRERAIARTREDILGAASRAFAASGFQAATMRDIAREAGYTPPALYTYFASKQEILRGLIDQVTAEIQATLDEPAAPEAGFEERLRTLLQRQIEVFRARRDVFDVVFSLPPGEFCAVHGGTPAEHPRERQIRHVARWIEANAAAADLGGRDPLDVARMLDAIGFVTVRRASLASLIADPAATAGYILEWFLYGLRGRPAPAAADASSAGSTRGAVPGPQPGPVGAASAPSRGNEA